MLDYDRTGRIDDEKGGQKSYDFSPCILRSPARDIFDSKYSLGDSIVYDFNVFGVKLSHDDDHRSGYLVITAFQHAASHCQLRYSGVHSI